MSLEVADGVILRVVRAAVGTVVTRAAEAGDEATLVPDEPEEK
jgi:hypothetical protein